MRRAATGGSRGRAPIELPPLHLVTGWSKADPAKKPHDPDVALFGGWRIGHLEKTRRSGK
jgi:hypothetical protein